MKIEQCIHELETTTKFGLTPDLNRERRLLARLGNPEKGLQIIHVAGTNGKGSCCTLTAAGLQACGFRVGLFTSPYLVRFQERIRVNGEEITDEALIRLTERVRGEEKALSRLGTEVTQFDLITAIALCYFAETGCDYCVMETGLGGRFDPTNAVEHPKVTAIMSISKDHTAILGDTLEKIAFQKAGIIKQGVPLVCCRSWPDEVRRVISAEAEKKQAPCIWPDGITDGFVSLSGTSFLYGKMPVRLRLIGAHQAENFASACEILRCLGMEERQFLPAMEQTVFAGRMELLQREPPVIADGAHNPDGIRSLCDVIDSLHNGDITVLMGMMADKDVRDSVLPVARRAANFVAVAPATPRAMEAGKLAHLAEETCEKVVVADSVQQGLEAAIRMAGKSGVVLCCGSLYLIGEVKTCFENDSKRQK